MIYWNSFADFLHMGGYGVYVWGSFGVTALIMQIGRASCRERVSSPV